MADKRISELTALTGANSADDDLLVIVDSSASETKSITLGELEKALGERDFSFADDDKLVFGDGDDLQIYHDSATSTNKVVGSIDVTGTVTADGLTVDGQVTQSGITCQIFLDETDATDLNTYLRSGSNGQFSIQTINDAHNSASSRFMINHSTGDISFYEDTGTTAKFFWDASAEGLNIGASSAPFGKLDISDVGGTGVSTIFDAASGDNYITSGASGIVQFRRGSTNTVKIDGSGNVGIGTSSPDNLTTLSTSGGNAILELKRDNANTSGAVGAINFTASDGHSVSSIYAQGDGDNEGAHLVFRTTSAAGQNDPYGANTYERMRIDSSGRVGIGTTPARQVHFHDGSGDNNVHITNSTTGSTATDGFTIVSQSTTNDVILNQRENADLIVHTNASEKMRIDSSGNVGIGTASPSAYSSEANNFVVYDAQNSGITIATGNSAYYSQIYFADGTTGDAEYAGFLRYAHSDNSMRFATNGGSEAMRIDSSGNLLVGKTTAGDVSINGCELSSSGFGSFSRDGNTPGYFNRDTSDGTIIDLRKDGATVGSIGVDAFDNCTVTANRELVISTNRTVSRSYTFGDGGGSNGFFRPGTDNDSDLGQLSNRWDDVYATNGTIQTSDRNEKQDIEELSEAEKRVAVAAKALMRKFRWKDAVAEKGDDARIHFGIIAQDLQAAFEAEGLDAGRYAMFIHSTWTDEETGEERSRMGVRYSELLAFIIAAI